MLLMYTFGRYLSFSVFLACFAHAGALDVPLTVATHDQVFKKMAILRDELSGQEFGDLCIAVRAIERQSEALLAAKLNKIQADDYFVALINGRTPRQVILTGAGIMIAEATEFGPPGTFVDLGKVKHEDFARTEYLTQHGSVGLSLIKAYGAPNGPQDKIGKSATP